MPEKTNKIAFQGEPGANSDTACRNVYPSMVPMPCPSFEDAFNAVETGKADLAMIPIENTIAGRVAFLYQGRVHAAGTPAELQASPDPIVQQFITGQSTGPMETPGF